MLPITGGRQQRLVQLYAGRMFFLTGCLLEILLLSYLKPNNNYADPH
jgi:hypothetical protein